MDETKKYFDSWFKSQGRILESMSEMTRKYQESFWGLGRKGGTPFGVFPNAFSSWSTAVLGTMRGSGRGRQPEMPGAFKCISESL